MKKEAKNARFPQRLEYVEIASETEKRLFLPQKGLYIFRLYIGINHIEHPGFRFI